MIREGILDISMQGRDRAVKAQRIGNTVTADPYATARAHYDSNIKVDRDCADLGDTTGEREYVNAVADRLLGWDGRGARVGVYS